MSSTGSDSLPWLKPEVPEVDKSMMTNQDSSGLHKPRLAQEGSTLQGILIGKKNQRQLLPTPAQILRDNAGALLSRTARSTKTVVTLYCTEEAHLDTDAGKYTTVCETHGYSVGHDTFSDARSWLSCPEEWCAVCQGEEVE
jgi:hypothetical protein